MDKLFHTNACILYSNENKWSGIIYIYIHLNEPNKENNDEVAEEHIH